jgi:hypothetical protein
MSIDDTRVAACAATDASATDADTTPSSLADIAGLSSLESPDGRSTTPKRELTEVRMQVGL